MTNARAVALVLLLLLALPMLGSAWGAMLTLWSPSAWQDLLTDPQTLSALGLTLWTGLLASALALLISAWLLSHTFPGPGWPPLVRVLSPLLALPHAAFAIGLVFLISPSGWLLRALSPWASGFEAPPAWSTTQDPWGLGLVLVLVAKEVPFLLWAAATQLQRPDVAQRCARELQIARSLGYTRSAAWRCVLWPQLVARLRWPLLAVLMFSLSVVDMALVIGPTSPPTLSVLAWQWLQDADPARNAQGAAAAWLLTAVVALAATLIWWLANIQHWRTRLTQGLRGKPLRHRHEVTWRYALLLPYLAVMLALGVGSVAGIWSFPKLWPETLTLQAWQTVASSRNTLTSTLTLALASALVALCWVVAWLEWAPKRWQAAMQRLVFLPLVLPPVLWVLGLHKLALQTGLDASWAGVTLAHTLAAVPYVLIALSPSYTGFDPRLRQLSATLGHARLVFLWRVKWPLLRAALACAFAIGFAVSVAQYLPTLFVGAGRITTVTTEAVTLAGGAQRTLTAAYAWLQWLLPVLVFALTAWLGQPRRYTRSQKNGAEITNSCNS